MKGQGNGVEGMVMVVVGVRVRVACEGWLVGRSVVVVTGSIS